mmetsp:Transcript_2/g.5  ORF Transcript_2/g.5 Transcript_2/m.5 type:complete len:365 (-) Transcript_2:30-1124(-)
MNIYSKGASSVAIVEDLPPDLHELFVAYDAIYFSGRLQAKGVFIRWSKKSMTRCAGYCRASPAGGVEIVISEPLHKYRTSTELKETVLHEMIHALDFITPNSKRDHDGHGAFFLSHMNRINSSTHVHDPYRPRGAAYHITIYHNFTNEVRSYQQHVWRCDRCDHEIRRSMNRTPSEKDCRAYRKDGSKWLHDGGAHNKTNRCGDRRCWIHNHIRLCGGTFVKQSSPSITSDRSKKREPGASASSNAARKKPKQQTLVDLTESGMFTEEKQIDERVKIACNSGQRTARNDVVIDVDSVDDVQCTLPGSSKSVTFSNTKLAQTGDAKLLELLEMGFEEEAARTALVACEGKVLLAVSTLLGEHIPT